MAGITQQSNVEFEQKELTITEVLQTQTLPIIVKTSASGTNRRILNQHGIPENRELLLQRKMNVKYARVKMLTSLDKDERQGQRNDEHIRDNHYLIPVKYHGKIKYVHPPGRRRRYASVPQVLQDLPRYITVWENTRALPCSGASEYITVEANTTLEIVRKATRPENKAVILECSNGETSVAFMEQDRLNCTAVDDTKLYNLFELVRSKLLPRVFQFDAVDPNDITHLNDALYGETLSAVDKPMELQGFTDVELLVGWARNEIQETYETVLIPRNIWTSVFVHKECPENKANTMPSVSRAYGPCKEVDFIEKSLYLLPLNQSKVMWLIGPTFERKGQFYSSNTNTEENSDTVKDEKMYHGPVVLLPQVKKKKTLFKKVHGELLRLFKSSNDVKPSQQKLKLLSRTKTTPTPTSIPKKLQKHYTKDVHGRISRCSSLREMRSEPTNLTCMRRNYGDRASYLEFLVGDPGCQPFTVKSEHSRLSVSLGDIPSAISSDKNSIENNTWHISSFCTGIEKPSDDYSEIGDTSKADEEAGGDKACLGTAPIEQSYEKRYAQESCVAMHNFVPSVKETQRLRIDPQEHIKNVIPTKGQEAEEVFYRYTVIETYECFKECGLEEFAVKCKEHKLDGTFFRNFNYEELKEDPFYLSKFCILKLTKIIHDGWRPT
ncbi:uncharacterized protein LOC123524708 [Mercenaria mercenaria]|uniref:uncharacterized protein LOC123524708 n=1 Tax=Mercenaria mercenaria TaxID=6596 RepID=UPI00234F011C|nr:uncharacterized protein LOC123524708 [Mercenaria mercenaria]